MMSESNNGGQNESQSTTLFFIHYHYPRPTSHLFHIHHQSVHLDISIQSQHSSSDRNSLDIYDFLTQLVIKM